MRRLAVLLFLVGCGSVKDQPQDSGVSGDGATDGPTVGDATVEVRLSGTPSAGLTVNFQDADGALVTEATTDTMGKAKATVHVGAMVTIAIGPRALVTITGVNPGETVVLKTPKPYDRSSAGNVTFSTAGEAPNKSFYRIDLGDDEFVTSVNMTSGARTLGLLNGNLDGNGKFNVYAGTYDANNHLISYTFLNGILPSSSGTTAVALPNNFRTDLNEFVLSVNGAPTGATQLAGSTWCEQATFQFAPTDFGTPVTPSSATISAGNAAVNQSYPGSFGDFVQTSASISFGATRESAAFWRRAARPAPAFTIASNDFPARIGAPTLDKSTPGRPIANWTLTGATVSGDATIVNLGWKDAANVAYTWLLYGKPDATSMKVPAVSAALAGQAPAQSTFTSVTVTEVNLEPMAGYAAFHLAPIEANFNTFPIPVGFTSWAFDTNNTSNP